MNTRRVVFSLLAAAFSLFCGPTATGEDTPLSLGSHFFKLGNYDAAISEYKRFLFFHPNDPRMGETYRNIGIAYREQGHWGEAVAAMHAAVQYASNPEEKSKYRLERAVIFIAAQDYDLGRLELIMVRMQNPSVPVFRRTLFLEAVAYIYQFQWAEAREALRNYAMDEKLETLLENAVNVPQKSPGLAKVLSAILPGAGQVYAGEWRNGLNALALNGVLGYVNVEAALNRHYVEAALWGGLIFSRYYRGNIFRADEAVKQFNTHQSRRASEALLQRLQEVAQIQQEVE